MSSNVGSAISSVKTICGLVVFTFVSRPIGRLSSSSGAYGSGGARQNTNSRSTILRSTTSDLCSIIGVDSHGFGIPFLRSIEPELLSSSNAFRSFSFVSLIQRTASIISVPKARSNSTATCILNPVSVATSTASAKTNMSRKDQARAHLPCAVLYLSARTSFAACIDLITATEVTPEASNISSSVQKPLTNGWRDRSCSGDDGI